MIRSTRWSFHGCGVYCFVVIFFLLIGVRLHVETWSGFCTSTQPRTTLQHRLLSILLSVNTCWARQLCVNFVFLGRFCRKHFCLWTITSLCESAVLYHCAIKAFCTLRKIQLLFRKVQNAFVAKLVKHCALTACSLAIKGCKYFSDWDDWDWTNQCCKLLPRCCLLVKTG